MTVSEATSPNSPISTRRGASLHTQTLAALWVLLWQTLHTFTGAIVRVTGSGLGCETWPNCQAGSLVPVPGAEPAIQQAIEFGNRLLALVLIVLCVWFLWSVFAGGRRTEIKALAWFQIAGFFVQAVVGGVSVWIDLKWYGVALHMLLSLVLIYAAAIAYVRVTEPDDAAPVAMYSPRAKNLGLVGTIAMAIVLITGTMTTGAGPHAGDLDDGMLGRFDVNLTMMTGIHTIAVIVFTVCAVVLVGAIKASNSQDRAKSLSSSLLGVIALQAIIGIVQYIFGLPRFIVPFHVMMAAVVTLHMGMLYAFGVQRLGTEQDAAIDTTTRVTA
ncbi:MAG: COX15/CtaA family protein [Corynebacterium sp.]|nr:COX15/CtaA family protein [Corynebacterium sp.]